MKKWILGGLGWVFLGPIGGIIGFLVGSAIDNDKILKLEAGSKTTRKKYTKTTNQRTHKKTYQSRESYGGKQQTYSYGIPTQLGDFMVSMLVLIAEVMRADGSILKSELNYVKKYFNEKFGEQKTSEALKILKVLLKKDIPLYDVSRQIQANLDYYSRLQLMHFLFGLANADGFIHPNELSIIEVIYKGMGISDSDYNSIKAMFIQTEESPYEILQISKNATADDIKNAYRKLAKEYHPDKVSYLGEDVQQSAQEKFQKISDAYERLKKIKLIN